MRAVIAQIGTVVRDVATMIATVAGVMPRTIGGIATWPTTAMIAAIATAMIAAIATTVATAGSTATFVIATIIIGQCAGMTEMDYIIGDVDGGDDIPQGEKADRRNRSEARHGSAHGARDTLRRARGFSILCGVCERRHGGSFG
ncbi:hypothetical protein [Varunaivibrio sulfuroxidans]|uniref:hypothetical protein n=1 Tax=Varunaivibrio sulfuroxidans TaxID=1773489 RepID=UPI00104BDF73|nr:hypothetical protein [Varunaivibrio sulfuroxidans]WES31629.1 hypothetical protein P3M64_04460 [Varunaivibrio sulfuroxidans]